MKDEESKLKKMLQFKIEANTTFRMDPRHVAIEKFVLDHGVLRQGRKLPRPYRVGKIKQCFKNAATLAFNNPGLMYVEGFAWRDGLPIEFRHAWVEDPFGQVIDTTWRKTSEKEEYLGVVIPRNILEQNMMETEYYSVFWTGPFDVPNFEILDKLKTTPQLVHAV